MTRGRLRLDREAVGALAVSIALHAAVLAAMPDAWTFRPLPPAPSLSARIEPAMRAPARAVAERRAVRAQSQRSPQVAAPEPAAIAPVLAEEVSQESAVDEVPAIAPSALDETRSIPAAADAAPAATAEAGATPDAGSLEAYRRALIGAARRHKLYPASAIDHGWQGKVAVRLVIGVDGQLTIAKVTSSSGRELLDRQALETMRKAKSLTPIPPALREREFSVDVAVVYELTEAR
jgi:protein TonB